MTLGRRIILGAAVLAMVACAWGVLRGRALQGGGLTLYGNIDTRQVDLAFRVGGRLAAMHVDEGCVVRVGTEIAALDAKPYDDEVRLAAAEAAQAAAQRDRLEKGLRPEEIAQARAVVEERTAALTLARANFERSANLLERKIIPEQSHDDATARYREAAAQSAVARAALELAELGPREEDVQAGRAAFEAASARLEAARTRRADAVLAAPAEGTVETRILEPGSMVAAGQAVAVLAVREPVWVRTYVDEPELGRIRPGMAAQVYTDSAPDKPYAAHVGFIASEAEFTPKSVETAALRTALVYRVRVVVDQPDAGLRRGMPVTVRLVADE